MRGDVLVACVADEEYASSGTEEVARRFRADAAIVTEPSHLELTIAHKGFVWFDVIVEGRAAHGSRPELGVDAIAKAGKFLVALEAYDRRLRANPTHPILRVGLGPRLDDRRRRRVVELSGALPHLAGAPHHPRRDAALGAGRARRDHRRHRRRRSRISAPSSKSGLNRGPFEVAETEPVVQRCERAASRALGGKPPRRGEPFWTDCAILKDAGIPCVMFGADGAGAHAATEWTTVASVRALAGILADTAIEFCR